MDSTLSAFPHVGVQKRIEGDKEENLAKLGGSAEFLLLAAPSENTDDMCTELQILQGP